MRKVRWGVLGTAKIARTKVIPAMQRGRYSTVTAIASRDAAKAAAAAAALQIPKSYGSYEQLLDDPRCGARQARAVREACRAQRGRGA